MSLLIAICIQFVLAGIVLWFLLIIGSRVIKLWRISKAAERLPMKPKHWLWGHTHEFPGFNESGFKYFEDLMKINPKVCVYLSTRAMPKVLVYHPDTVKDVLKIMGRKPHSMGVYGYGKNWIGNGLLVSSGSHWRRNRKLVTPAFHFESLKQYVHIYEEASDVFLKKLELYSKKGKGIEIFHNICQLTLNIILRCTLSYEEEIQTFGKRHPYVSAVENMTKLWFKRIFRPWEHFDFIYNWTIDAKSFLKSSAFVNEIADGIIEERMKSLKESKRKGYLDFLDMLLSAKDENGEGLTRKDIRDEINTFIFGGFDTTASTISWALYSLAQHPHYQKLCQEEIDGLTEGRNDEPITWNDLHHLKYLTMFIKETMRYYSPVPLIERELDQPLIIDGSKIPIGTVVVIHLYNLHRNPTVWHEPMKFDPERFLTENISKMDHFAFVPFSAGPRNCIGQNFAMNEIKLSLAKILQKFAFCVDESCKVEREMAMVVKPKHEICLKVTKRHSSN